jgi:hypothetical protein
MSVVFFRGGTAPAVTSRAPADHITIQTLSPASGDGVNVQAQEIAEQGIAAVTEADGFQACKQAALLFIEQPIEKQDRGFEFIERNFEAGRVNGHRDSPGAAARQSLVPAIRRFDGRIQILAIEFGPAQPLPLNQMA